MASLTEEQKAFLTRKMKTRFCALDIDRNGFITTNDYDELARRWIEFGKLTGEQATSMKKTVQGVCDTLGLKPGMQVSLEQFLKSAVPYQQRDNEAATAGIPANFSAFFDAVDTNKNGVISLKEFEVYFDAMGVGKQHAKASFDAIDTNGDGSITRDEFVSTALEFFCNTDPAHPSKLFFGPLVD